MNLRLLVAQHDPLQTFGSCGTVEAYVAIHQTVRILANVLVGLRTSSAASSLELEVSTR